MFYPPTTDELEKEFDGVRTMILVPSRPVHSGAIHTIREGIAELQLPSEARIWMHVHVNKGNLDSRLFSQIDLLDKNAQPDDILRTLLLNRSVVTVTTTGLICSAAEQVRGVFLSSPVFTAEKA